MEKQVKTSNSLIAVVVFGALCIPALLFAGDEEALVAIRLVDVEPASYSTIDPKTILRFEVDVEFLSAAESTDLPVLVSIHFESKEDGKSVSRYMEAEFESLPRISESQRGLVVTYPVDLVRQQRNLKIPVVARVVASVLPGEDNRPARVGESEPVTFYVSEDW